MRQIFRLTHYVQECAEGLGFRAMCDDESYGGSGTSPAISEEADAVDGFAPYRDTLAEAQEDAEAAHRLVECDARGSAVICRLGSPRPLR